MKTFKVILFCASFALLLNSCGSQKEVAATADPKPEASVYVDNQAAQEAFVDALKAKLLEDYEDAEKLLQRSLKLDPNNAAAYYELAGIYFRQGNYDEAQKHIKPAVDLDAKNKWYSLLYAEVLAYKNQYMQAAAMYEKVIRQNPAEVELYFDWAYMLIKAEKLEEAVKVYDMYETEVGIDENIIVQKQRLYVRMGKLEKAVAEVKKLIASDPAEPRYYKILADLYESNNMKDKAAKVYEELLRIDRDNPNALLYLADMYRVKGDQAQAMEYLKKAFSNPSMDIDTKVRILFPYLHHADMQIKIINTSNNPIPEYKTEFSAGFDVQAFLPEGNVELKPLERKLIPTGLFFELPKGYEAQVRPRSGLAAKNGITVLNSPGTIDADYRGEVKVILVNLSAENFTINSGDRIAQVVISKHEKAVFEEAQELEETTRGAGGFGHTGVR